MSKKCDACGCTRSDDVADCPHCVVLVPGECDVCEYADCTGCSFEHANKVEGAFKNWWLHESVMDIGAVNGETRPQRERRVAELAFRRGVESVNGTLRAYEVLKEDTTETLKMAYANNEALRISYKEMVDDLHDMDARAKKWKRLALDAATVMNALAVGRSTQEAIERAETAESSSPNTTTVEQGDQQ